MYREEIWRLSGARSGSSSLRGILHHLQYCVLWSQSTTHCEGLPMPQEPASGGQAPQACKSRIAVLN